jgi:hypothetical protein
MAVDQRKRSPHVSMQSGPSHISCDSDMTPSTALAGSAGDADSSPDAVMILLAALAGLRVHEVAKVRGEDVDIDARTLRITGKMVGPPGSPMPGAGSTLGWWDLVGGTTMNGFKRLSTRASCCRLRWPRGAARMLARSRFTWTGSVSGSWYLAVLSRRMLLRAVPASVDLFEQAIARSSLVAVRG